MWTNMSPLSLSGSQVHHFITSESDRWTNETLFHFGCLSMAPITPRVAFSLRTLALYWQTHCSCPQLSMEAEVRVLCSLNCMSSSIFIIPSILTIFIRFPIAAHSQVNSRWHMMFTSTSSTLCRSSFVMNSAVIHPTGMLSTLVRHANID